MSLLRRVRTKQSTQHARLHMRVVCNTSLCCLSCAHFLISLTLILSSCCARGESAYVRKYSVRLSFVSQDILSKALPMRLVKAGLFVCDDLCTCPFRFHSLTHSRTHTHIHTHTHTHIHTHTHTHTHTYTFYFSHSCFLFPLPSLQAFSLVALFMCFSVDFFLQFQMK